MAKALKSNKTNFDIDLKSYYKTQFNHIKKLHNLRAGNVNKVSGRFLARRRSKAIDDLIINYLSYSGFNNLKDICIIALGSYGRNELCPYSDVDFMFLYQPGSKKKVKDLTENLLYKLWDLNLEIGHATRTISDCVELSHDQDTTVLTSILESRFVFGDEALYKSFNRVLFYEILPKVSSIFIESKITENKKRIDKYGKSIYLLEPNVKESVGGLRDIHYALWISQAKFKTKLFRDLLMKGILLESELNSFRKNLDFLLSIRSQLHYLAEKSENSIRFEFQEDIAKYLGFKDGKIRAVEKFMRIYYLRANQTTELANKLIDRCIAKPISRLKYSNITDIGRGFILQANRLTVKNRNIIINHPENLMYAFEIADKLECEFSGYISDLIREYSNRKTISDSFRQNSEIYDTFLSILQNGRNVSKALFEMNRLRFLGHYIPEFGKVVCMAQYDAYHVYTVDIHSIFMVREIEKLQNDELIDEFPLLTKLVKEINKKYILYLACLFHDIGKGEGSNHSQKGAAMIPKLSKRMKLQPEDSEVLEFMVKHHLIMPHFSQRRDLNDESLIIRFARSVKTSETLMLLYLLAFADMRSVGPDTWTDWKGMLLEQLFIKALAVLDKGEYKKENPEETKIRYIKEVSSILKRDIKQNFISKLLKGMPGSYFKGFSPNTVARHIRLIKKAGDGVDFHVSYHPTVKFDDFIFWGFNTPGTFYKLCGVLSANGLNIMGARIATRDDKRILDVFYVNRLGDSTVEAKEIWTRVKNDLDKVLSGELKAKQLLEKKVSSYSSYEKKIPTKPSRIEIDNESSDYFTIIDYYSHDRIGLLYEVSKALYKLGLSINYAKISTKVDQVSDVFYVTDENNKKVISNKKLKKIKDVLLLLDSRN